MTCAQICKQTPLKADKNHPGQVSKSSTVCVQRVCGRGAGRKGQSQASRGGYLLALEKSQNHLRVSCSQAVRRECGKVFFLHTQGHGN